MTKHILDDLIASLEHLDVPELIRMHSAALARIEEISFKAAGIDATEALHYEDLSPVDLPVESRKNEKTGQLQIRFPFSIAGRSNLGWRVLEVTPAAQAVLLQILSESVQSDEKAGRIQSKPVNFQ